MGQEGLQDAAELGQMDQETYLKERASLIDAEHSSSDEHDKAALTLSGGALALSITFLEKIAPNPSPESTWILFVAWAGFILSITSVLAGFHLSQLACRKQRDILDQMQLSGGKLDVEPINRFSNWTLRLNYASFGFFVVGVAFLAWYVGGNLPTSTPATPAAAAPLPTNP